MLIIMSPIQIAIWEYTVYPICLGILAVGIIRIS